MTEREPVEAWILDDTGFIKKGEMSPGVQRQHTGSAGKTTNCQSGVSLTVATRTMELPVDMDLYLPQSWAKDRKRCRAAHIPTSVEYRAKWRIALDLVERAVDAGYPPGLVLADAGYGDVGDFWGRSAQTRAHLRSRCKQADSGASALLGRFDFRDDVCGHGG